MHRSNAVSLSGLAVAVVVLTAASAAAQVGADAPAVQTKTVTCLSAAGEREHCAANTSAGIALVRSTGSGECLLGKTWGYDDTGVWVSDGCGGEFQLGQVEAES